VGGVEMAWWWVGGCVEACALVVVVVVVGWGVEGGKAEGVSCW